MAPSQIERAARMHVLAAEFRGFAAQTRQEDYRHMLLRAAAMLDLEAELLEQPYLAAAPR
jgi:hypothetical protein